MSLAKLLICTAGLKGKTKTPPWLQALDSPLEKHFLWPASKGQGFSLHLAEGAELCSPEISEHHT